MSKNWISYDQTSGLTTSWLAGWQDSLI